MANPNRIDVHERVNAKLVEMMEAGGIPWQRQWARGRARSRLDPRPAGGVSMSAGALKKRVYEFKLARVREVGASRAVDSPVRAYAYWQEVIREAGWFTPCKEHLVVLLLNTWHNIEGHAFVSIGTLSQSLAASPRNPLPRALRCRPRLHLDAQPPVW
jgi:hypothetical protein